MGLASTVHRLEAELRPLTCFMAAYEGTITYIRFDCIAAMSVYVYPEVDGERRLFDTLSEDETCVEVVTTFGRSYISSLWWYREHISATATVSNIQLTNCIIESWIEYVDRHK